MSDTTKIAQPYLDLQERLAKNPLGAPAADELFEIFQILFTEEEASFASKIPLIPSGIDAIAEATGIDGDELTALLDSLADKGLILDVKAGDGYRYMLAPPVIGFLEYTFMKRNEHLPMERLAHLADSYVSTHLVQELVGAETERTRVVPYESALGPVSKEVVDYERAKQLIIDAGPGSLGSCYCRREAKLRGEGCDLPVDDICMGLGRGAEYLVRRGFARAATVDELLKKLDETEEMGLVHTCDNVREKAVFMCHCCGCCCHLLRTITEQNTTKFTAPSRYVAVVNEEDCMACGLCADRCHMNVITIGDEAAHVDAEKCIGCGVCIPPCPTDSIHFIKREGAADPPKNLLEVHMKIAAEKDRLKHFQQ